MADAPEQNPKIDSLRAKVQADPKSRHFYPLAEELRKVGQLDEAEKVLRAGLVHHASYLSAWISLGRVLKDRGAYSEAVDVLMRGLSLDPENVVAAKLLANVHLAKGDKVEAIKKFKLVHALMPTDEEAETQIDRLDRELNPQTYTPADAPAPADAISDSTAPPFPESEPVAAPPPTDEPVRQDDRATNFDLTNPDPFALGMDEMRPVEPAAPEPELADEATPFGDAELPEPPESVNSDAEPTSDPLASLSVPETVPARAPSSEDVWAAEEEAGTELPESAATVTMAQILVQQGDLVRARETYRRVLERDPGNVEARNGLEALEPRQDSHPESGSRRVARLEAWRRKVAGS